jgi:hypothetical protein
MAWLVRTARGGGANVANRSDGTVQREWALDLLTLTRGGRLRPGAAGTVARPTSIGFPLPTRWRVAPDLGSVRLEYVGRTLDVRLDWTAQATVGGRRPWWRCPGCVNR